jgi:DUF4097 and DUF4098 domain-containing protein YvlB
MQKSFETPEPISLYVELGSGTVLVTAGSGTAEDPEQVTHTTVTIEGEQAEEAVIEHKGRHVVVVAPSKKTAFFGRPGSLSISVTMPADSEITTKLGSADLVATGRLGTARLRSGSGDLRVEELAGEAVLETGSGDITVDKASGDLRIKSGSGDSEVGTTHRSTVVSSGSGDVVLGTTRGTTVVKSGSGDILVKDADADLAVSTASGDVQVDAAHRGSLKVKGVSGDVRVGVPAGVPVWTDVSCVSGRVSSSLESVGQPEEGQDFLEIRATTVSGDIRLEQR